MKRTAAEKVGDLTGCDIAEVREGRYRPGNLSNSSVFVVGEDYYAAHPTCPKHDVGQPWVKNETFRGDVVWVSKMATI